MNALVQDLRYAVRALRNSPGFTLVAVLTLALGIGANSAIFSVVHSVLLRPFPYEDPSRLVVVWETQLQHGLPFMYASPPNYADWREQNQVFEQMAVFATRAFFFTTVARLEEGVSLERAEAEMITIASRLETDFPDSNAGE